MSEMGQNAKLRGDRRMSAFAPKADISPFMSTRPSPESVSSALTMASDAALLQIASTHFNFIHVVVMEELVFAIICDPHARPIARRDFA